MCLMNCRMLKFADFGGTQVQVSGMLICHRVVVSLVRSGPDPCRSGPGRSKEASVWTVDQTDPGPGPVHQSRAGIYKHL